VLIIDPAIPDRLENDVADFWFIALTCLVFGALLLCAKGSERL